MFDFAERLLQFSRIHVNAAGVEGAASQLPPEAVSIISID